MRKLQCVIGGAASGKSALAERLVRQRDKAKIYVATLQPYDAEMHAKITTHQRDRGPDWTTIEAPLDVVSILETATPAQIVLLDCATLWLTNILLAERDIDADCAALVAGLTACQADVVVVSNEVGMGIVPDNALSRQFRNAQGKLNQMLAQAADDVVTVIAGLPLALKGTPDLAGLPPR